MKPTADKPGLAYLGVAGRIARTFIDSKLTPLIIVASVLLGLAAIWRLPREEEPQIKVPMIDVLVSMPGFSAKEVEERATRPMEKLLWEIPGVEYIYSTSSPGESLVIVRFLVGEDVERSLVKLTEKLRSNFDRIPHGVSFPLIKPRSIDDVPMLTLTFHSALGALLLAGCRKEQLSAPESLPVVTVRVQSIELKPHIATEDAVGTVRPKLHSVIEAKVSGQIAKMFVVAWPARKEANSSPSLTYGKFRPNSTRRLH